ncbi:MAG: hypothetical protein PVI21_04780 [Candidatus Woesebacteria bacterium]|jgi:hypothetical protein
MIKSKPIQNILKCSFKILLIVLVPVVVGWLVYWGFVFAVSSDNPFISNPAKDAATPIEKSLLAAGATKVCSSESNGTNPLDNTHTPYYSGYYQFNVGKDQVYSEITKATKDSGFSLSLGAQLYESVFSYDGTRSSIDKDLKEGDERLSIDLYTNTEAKNLPCPFSGGSPINLVGDTNHTGVRLTLSFPPRK